MNSVQLYESAHRLASPGCALVLSAATSCSFESGADPDAGRKSKPESGASATASSDVDSAPVPSPERDEDAGRDTSNSPKAAPAFDADAFMAKARAKFGGSWKSTLSGGVTGFFPSRLGDRDVDFRLLIVAANYDSPQGREAIARMLNRMSAPFRVIGVTEGLTALVVWPHDDHPVVRWLSETLQLQPVDGPKDRDDFVREYGDLWRK